MTMNGEHGPSSLTDGTQHHPAPQAQLLDCVASLVSAERGLTRSIERTLPLLHRRQSLSTSVTGTSSTAPPPILPTPASMSEVETVLAVARMYSSRTSAPAGWKPTLPVFGFATPNPLPHQLRGGALGALQLRAAREERRRKKTAAEDKEKEEKAAREEDKRKKKAAEEEKAAVSANKRGLDGKDGAPGAGNGDPKRRELNDRHKSTAHAAEDAAADLTARRREQQKQRQAQQRQVQAASMNLSDSSSEEEDDDDSSEED